MILRWWFLLGLAWPVTVASALPRDPDRVVVAADGSGDVRTIQEAVNKVQWHRPQPVEIIIRPGVYREVVRVPREKPNLRFRGAGRDQTIVEALNNERLHPEAGWPARAVFVVEADDVQIENLTIRNLTPKGGSQAEALYVNGERVIVRDCAFFSFQDTLHLTGRVYVENCYVEGDVDFAWGYGAVMFVRCELKAIADGYYVQSRNAAGRPGMIFVDCTLSAAPGVEQCWLGRIELDRFPASQVAYLSCRMGPHVPPEGWIVTGEGSRDDLRFEEYDSRNLAGQRVDVSSRLAGSTQLSAAAAEALVNPRHVLGGDDDWDPTAP